MDLLALEVPAHLMKLEKPGSTFFIKSNFILNQWNNMPLIIIVVRTQKREREFLNLSGKYI